MSLRDALLKAGKVSKDQAKRAAAEQRRERKAKGGGHVVETEKQAEVLAREAERRAKQVAENRERAEAERAAREAQERAMRVGNLITAWTRRPRRDARRPWHFVRSNGRIGTLLVDQHLAAELEFGAAGIVEMPSSRIEVRVVGREGVRKLVELFSDGVRFYVGDGAPADPLVCPPPRARLD